MNAVELILPDNKPSGVFMCSKCRILAASCHSPVRVGERDTTDEEKSEYARKQADRCCDWKCEKCGAKSKPHNMHCNECSSIEWSRQAHECDATRFAKAKKLTPEEWSKLDDVGPMLLDELHDKWFTGLDDVEEWYADDEERIRPSHLWCSTETGFEPDFEGNLRDRMNDNCHEEADENIPQRAWDELNAFEKKWWEENKVLSYEPDYSRCVVLLAIDAISTATA